MAATTVAGAVTRSRISGSAAKAAYTQTGGSGREATPLSGSLAEARSRVLNLYRTSIRDIPEMRKNYNLNETPALIRDCIRAQFEMHAGVRDAKVLDMLVFKGRQNIDEIRAQWKGRHQVTAVLLAHEAALLREAAASEAAAAVAAGAASGDGGAAAAAVATGEAREAALREWAELELVPPSVATWPQFLRWQAEQDGKFEAWAVGEKGLFSEAELAANKAHAEKTSGCSIM